MKKSRFKRLFKHFKRIIVLVIVVVLFVFLPMVKMGEDDNYQLVLDSFVGAKSKYQGVFEIWNIDTFEGGKISKTVALSNFAKDFQRKNKGAYIIVRNVSETECENLLKMGQVPDLFSCSYGVAEIIKPYLQAFSNGEFGLPNNFTEAGKNEKGELMGVAWCMNNYFLISTPEYLTKSKVEIDDSFRLSDRIFEMGYDVALKNSTKTIYSCLFGSGKYQMPLKALESYNNIKVSSISEKALNRDAGKTSSYSAYCDFIAGKGVVLIGNYRDVIRMENRKSLGKVEDVVVEQVLNFSDMVQFLFLTKTDDVDKRECEEKFVKFVTESVCQKQLCENGILPVNLDDKQGVMKHIVLDKIKDYSLLNVFVSKKEIEEMRQY